MNKGVANRNREVTLLLRILLVESERDYCMLQNWRVAEKNHKMIQGLVRDINSSSCLSYGKEHENDCVTLYKYSTECKCWVLKIYLV